MKNTYNCKRKLENQNKQANLEKFVLALDKTSSPEERCDLIDKKRVDVASHLSVFELIYDETKVLHMQDLQREYYYPEHFLRPLFFPEKFKAKYILRRLRHK